MPVMYTRLVSIANRRPRSSDIAWTAFSETAQGPFLDVFDPAIM
jgi:hypothetical protein